MKVEKIKEIVRSELKKIDQEDALKYHFVIVEKYALILADKLNANKEIVQLAAWLHDIGRIKFGETDHHITGAKEVEKILKELDYPENTIKSVRDCILTHRGLSGEDPKTIEAKIIIAADTMAHYDALPFLFKVAFRKRFGEARNFEEGFQWVCEKIDRGWNSKLQIPEAKEMMKDKYEAIKKVLDSIKEYM